MGGCGPRWRTGVPMQKRNGNQEREWEDCYVGLPRPDSGTRSYTCAGLTYDGSQVPSCPTGVKERRLGESDSQGLIQDAHNEGWE